jgi:hypothetical protein
MKTIYYVSGGCGSGKTEGAIAYMRQRCHIAGKNILLVQPTKRLLQQTDDRIRQLYPDQRVFLIHGSDDRADWWGQEPVKARIMAFMTEERRGVVLGITHAAFLSMPSWKRTGDWELIIDEIPPADGTFQLNVPETFRWFISDFEIDQGHGSYFRLTRAIGRQRRFDDLAVNREKDDLLAVLRELYARVNSRGHEVCVPRDSWLRLGMPRFDADGRHGALICHWTLRPELLDVWDKPTIMGANFTNSMLHQLWQGKVNFAPHPHIRPAFDQYPREVSERLTIRYVSERRNSVRLQERREEQFRAAINESIAEHWHDEPFLWVANTKQGDDFVVRDGGTRISPITHGRNDCRNYTRIAFFAALNDTPPHFKFLNDACGIPSDVVHEAKTQEIIHQAIMRTALRDAASCQPVEALVVDRATADQLKARLFPAACVAGPDAIDPAFVEHDMVARERARTTLAMTQAERDRKAREAKKRLREEQARLSLLLSGHKIMCGDFVQTQDRHYDPDLIYKPEIVVPGISASFVPAKTSGQVLTHRFTGWADVREVMRRAFDLHYKAKDDNILMSGAKFDPRLSPDTRRGLANIEYVAFMQLDFDGGDLSIDELRVVFDDFAWLAYNSFNNDLDEGQLRYRVFIPFLHPVTVSYYHHLWDALAARIEQFGFTLGEGVPGKRFSGLDKSKRTANSIFYMPCQSRRNYRRNSFFDDSQWDEARILDPLNSAWLDAMDFMPEEARAPLPVEESPHWQVLERSLLALKGDRDEAEIADALDEMRQACMSAAPSTGNATLFLQAAKMKRLGISSDDIQRQLHGMAPLMRHPQERGAQIPSIMKTLRRRAA